MAAPTALSKRWIAFILIFGLWTLIGLSFAGQLFISSSQTGSAISWKLALSHSLADWYVFALLSFIPLRQARRFGLDGPDWGARFAIHFMTSIVFSILFVALRSFVALWQPGVAGLGTTYVEAFKVLLGKTWHFNLLIYWVILSVAHALEFYRKFQERVTRTAELEKRLVEARLQALQMQLNPHFLFNTLHAISALMHQDVDAADRMITRLSELLRHALESTEQQEVPLQEEIDFLKRYLEIEETRFGDRLKIELNIAPDTTDLLVPNLVLQPLVENAIQHGIEPHARAGRVTISSRRERDDLLLEVRDTGNGAPAGEWKEGVGLTNTRNRLRQLYGDGQTFNLGSADGGGFRAAITLPCRSIAVNPSTG
ncbi:histidine kinase [bacterium]|nr:histidine kinase [bacterium]